MGNYPVLQFMASESTAGIHQAALRILDEVGVVMTQPQAREFLAGSGAVLDGNRIHLPPELVTECLGLCPPQVSLLGRGGGVIHLGDGSLHWHNLGGARDIFDPAMGERRPALVQDVRDSARLLDALPQVSAVTPFFTPQDVPGKVMSLAMYRHSLPNTTKPLHGPGVQTAGEVRLLAAMASVFGEPAVVLTVGISPLSPLTFPDSISEAIIEAARLKIPVGPLPCPTAGATAPLSLAGALAQQHAEVLATLVLAQRVHPRLPVFYCGRLAMMDPRMGGSVWGGVELGIASAVTVLLAHYCRLPVNVYGLSTNAHTLDLQSGYERAINAALPALAGADELSGIGEMSAGVMGSYTQMVIDNEIAASIQRMRRGLAVDPDSLAVEVIASVMNGARNFLSEPHTVKYLRGGELYVPTLAERRGWQDWLSGNRVGMVERARAEADHLLAAHQVEPLDQAQERELDAILHSAQGEA